jgi:hypothetical protein
MDAECGQGAPITEENYTRSILGVNHPYGTIFEHPDQWSGDMANFVRKKLNVDNFALSRRHRIKNTTIIVPFTRPT